MELPVVTVSVDDRQNRSESKREQEVLQRRAFRTARFLGMWGQPSKEATRF